MSKTLEEHLKQIEEKGQAIVVPYMMAGDGGLDQLEAQLHFLADAGASAIEVGIPFSDPVADGPVIQTAGQRSLGGGTTLKGIIDVLKKSTVKTPLVIMTYFNPIYFYGLEKFVADLQETPVKGLIIPDLPYEHQDYIAPLLSGTDLALVPLMSLTSPRERMAQIAKEAEGFIYAVTVNGTTGQRTEFGTNIDEHIQYLKSVSPVPVLAGFGISQIDHVKKFMQDCDGVIIGSKVVNMLANGEENELSAFLTEAANVKKA